MVEGLGGYCGDAGDRQPAQGLRQRGTCRKKGGFKSRNQRNYQPPEGADRERPLGQPGVGPARGVGPQEASGFPVLSARLGFQPRRMFLEQAPPAGAQRLLPRTTLHICGDSEGKRWLCNLAHSEVPSPKGLRRRQFFPLCVELSSPPPPCRVLGSPWESI